MLPLLRSRSRRTAFRDTCTSVYIVLALSALAQGEPDELIERHPIYNQLGSSEKIRQAGYREPFRHHIDNETLHDIRDALNHELVLGRSCLKAKIEEITKRQTRLGYPGRPKVEEEAAVYCVLG